MEADPGGLSITAQMLILLLLVLINAFFAAAEMALVSLNKTKIKIMAEDAMDGDARAERVLLLLEEPTHFLSTVQVVVTLVGFMASAFASYNLSDVLVRQLGRMQIYINPQLGVVIVTLILAYFTLVFGELFPKRLGMIYAERIALFAITPIRATASLFGPFVRLLSKSVGLLMKIFRQDEHAGENEFYEEDSLAARSRPGAG